MLLLVYRLMPRQGMFFPLFEHLAAVIVTAARALREMLKGEDQVEFRFKDILRLEHEADDIAQEVLLGLRTSFITQFDRADIQSLITSMDDSIDQMQQTAKAIVLFETTTFEPDMGAARSVSAVRWGIAGSILIAWVVTLPSAALIGALFYALVSPF